jgi:repressor LexA
MSMSLTHAQAELLAFIERFQRENNGVSPSFQEMMEGMGLHSKSNIHRLITALVERGRIARRPRRARAIEILDEPPAQWVLGTYSSLELLAELARRGAANREGPQAA